MRKILSYLFYGIGWGCACFVAFSAIFLLASDVESISFTRSEYFTHALSSICAGIFCASSSIVYTFDKLSFQTQVLTHVGIGLGGYFAVAYFANWIPTENTHAAIAMILFVVIFFFLIWAGFYLFYKAEAKRINRQLNQIKANKKS